MDVKDWVPLVSGVAGGVTVVVTVVQSRWNSPRSKRRQARADEEAGLLVEMLAHVEALQRHVDWLDLVVTHPRLIPQGEAPPSLDDLHLVPRERITARLLRCSTASIRTAWLIFSAERDAFDRYALRRASDWRGMPPMQRSEQLAGPDFWIGSARAEIRHMRRACSAPSSRPLRAWLEPLRHRVWGASNPEV